jgi:glycosyltransferase involved in cell wall biosynthesis
VNNSSPAIAIFAHNEEARIGRCLESLTWASRDTASIDVTVLINGSRDRTETIVRDWAANHPNVKPVVIDVGDKANAWNVYVGSGLSFGRNHYFLDGDCWLPPFTIDVLEAEFQTGNPLCVAPMPFNVSDSLREFLARLSLPCGTMYGLSGEFLKRVVDEKIRMPLGFIGDDNLIASMVHSNLDDAFGNYDKSRVRIVDRIGPVAHRPPPFSRATFRLQRGRLRRYALRRVQMELLNHHVKIHGLRTLPKTARELSKYWKAPGLRWYFRIRGFETPYVWRALWRVWRESRSLKT